MVLFDQRPPPDETLVAMVRRLDADPSLDAVGPAEAVTDAIKAVEPDQGRLLVVGSVDRTELVTLGLPAVVRRTAWEGRKIGSIGLVRP